MSFEVKSTVSGDVDAENAMENIWRQNRIVPGTIDACVHTAISHKASEHPEKTAVSAWDGELTYRELDEISTRLALHLGELGVCAETIVPLCFEKSMWTPVAALGVLKAGGAFTLLDISTPEARLYAVVQQCRATVICSSYSNRELCSRLAADVVIVGSEENRRRLKRATTLSLPAPNPAWPMYVCFTSGSTGNPKGIVITHSSMYTALQNQLCQLDFNAESRTFDFASYSFDVAVHNIFATLVAGACLCIPSDMDRKYRLAESIRATGATIVNLTASVSRLIEPDMVPNLQTLLFLGEAVTRNDIERWWGKVRVINTYGPAECTPISTINLTGKSPSEASHIGKGVGVLTWVVDPENHDNLTSYGEIGELLLEGPVLARGYLQNPKQTAAAFIQDPAWLLRGTASCTGRHGRLYKTGDLVRYDENGGLIFIGRKDTQVKIRGQRVELGEVEYHVQKSLTSVSHVVAEVIEIGKDKARAVLVAFLEVGDDIESPNEDGSSRNSWDSSRPTSGVASRRSSQDTDTLNSYLTSRSSLDTRDTVSDASSYPEASTKPTDPRITEVLPTDEMEISSRLPPYMVPTVYFRIAKIPLSPTGKANRKLLREVGSKILSDSATFQEAPEKQQQQQQSLTDEQLHLRHLWALVLDIPEESISLDCNFFKLGADSISVIKLVGAAHREGLILSVENIFEHPTLAAQTGILGFSERQTTDSITPFCLLDMKGEDDVLRLRRELSVLCFTEESSIEDAYPCTPLQEGFMALNSKRTGDYVLQNVLELSDNVNLNTLWEAWDKTVQSSPILRTTIIQHDQLNFVQVVCKQRTEIHEEKAERLEDYLQKDKLSSMDTGERLSRFTIIRDGTTKKPRWCVWTVHHALVDGWSIPLVLESFNNAYQGLATESSTRPEFNLFVKYLNSTSPEDAESYWRSYLGNGQYTAFPTLPSSSKEVKADTVVEYEQLLPKRTDKIDEDLETTITTLVRAALAIMISSQTGQNDVVFGTTLSGRNTPIPSIENMVASTIATVPVRVELQAGKTISDLLHQLQRQAIEMIPYEQTGLQKIAKIDEDSRTACDFQTLVVVQPQDVELQTESACGIWQSSYEQQIPTTYAITIECILQTDGIKIRASFDSSIMPKWRMERMLQQFGTLLERLSNAQAGQTVNDIDHLTSQDESLVWKWNKMVPNVIDRPIHDMIIERTTGKPEAAALCGNGQQQTYRDLEANSTRLAHHLLRLGVGPNTIVPLVFEKSIWTVVAMLAVLKAGGAFTPLDPGQAGERRRTILEKTKAQLVLASPMYADISLAPGCFSFEVSHSSILSLPEAPRDASLPQVSTSSAAYVIFTSGSTGEPKGVVLEHNAVTTSSCNYGPRIGIRESSRVLQFASYTFDASILEIITTLILGGCVCVPSETERTTNIAAAINNMAVSFTLLTPTVARMIQPKDVPGLHTLVLGGEAVAKSDYDLWSSLPNLVNAYGPTECAVCSVAGRLNGGKTRNDSMGTPVGCVGWVVNPSDHSKLVPVGAVGELLLEGPILARGYLDDVEKTASAFIESPSWLLPERSGRLYKTGDLVRYNQDGSLCFVSRKDTQVKISGQRMELGEIEHYLRECIPGATQVVAEVIKPPGLESGLLAAFVEVHERTQAETFPLLGLSQEVEGLEIVQTHTSLHTELSERLPTYMIPRVYLRLSQIPLSASGKIDRRRLRDLALGLSAQDIADAQSSEMGNKRRPETGPEQQLCSLWAEVLGLNPSTIGLDDSFFRLGGDSVIAMKLVAAARREGISITVADVFRQPSLGAQAGMMQGAQVEKPETVAPFQLINGGATGGIIRLRSELSALCGVDSSLIEDAYHCTPLQEGLISLTEKRSGNYILQMVLELSDDINIEALRAALEKMSQELAVLRTRIVEHNRLGLVQVVCQESISWAEAQVNKLEDFLQRDKLVSMGLGSLLSRFSLINDASDQPHWLVWTVHHALYDGWSLPLMLDLVNEFYQRPVTGKQPGFNTFVKYIAETKDHDPEMFWESYLADSQSPAIAAINTVDDPMADTTLEYEQILPTGWTSRQTETTTSTLVRAAMAILISRHTGAEDVNFGATVSGRNAPVPRIEQIAGPTIATVPIRIKLEKEMRVLDYLEEVQEGILQMIPYEQMGLQRIAKLSESAQLACDFQVLLVVQPAENKHQNHKVGQWQLISSQKGFSTYPLTVECILEEGSVRFKGTFDSRVAEKWKVDMMLSQLGSILRQLADAGPSQRLEDINTLLHDKKLLCKWNESIPEAVEKCIHELVEDHVQRQPKAPAVCSWDGELTYSELDRLSTQLASHLAGTVKPETFVPLCFEKSMWTIVSMLAVLKAGAAFVLLDPGLPQGRLQLICRKVKAVIALTSVAHRNRLVNIVPQVLTVGPGITELTPSGLQPPKVKPGNVAYIIFTSGSTGTPKGCIIEHRSYCTAALSHGSDIEFSNTTRALQYGSYIFAGAIMEILMTLINGGCICVLSDEERGGSRLAQAICRLDANWAFLTSSVLAFLKPEEVPSLRTVCIGGEAIRGSQIREWAPHVHLRQTYGSAETSAVASLARLTESAAPTEVGRAVTSRFWIVNPENMNQLMPVGAAGEVVVEGAVVGRGYLDDPEKTAAAFIPPPAWASEFGILENPKVPQFYRTGDLAAYKSDGSIELLGRKDMQVKLQGQRIELGEIEHQIVLATTDVAEAAVEFALPNKKEGRNKAMLVGFIVWRKNQDGQAKNPTSGHDQSDWKSSALRKVQSSLETVLPYFMVPSVLISLPELPYTVSKKVDRRRLREIAFNLTADQMAELQKGLAGEKRVPRTLKEKRLQHLWAQVLDIDKTAISLNDNFFQLGGDSVTAMRLVGAARKAGVTMTVADIFRQPVLSSQAQQQTNPPTAISNEIIPAFSLLVEPEGRPRLLEELADLCAVDASHIEDAYPCTPLQEGLLSLTAKRSGDYTLQNVFEIPESIHIDTLKAAWQSVVSKTPILRTRIVNTSLGMTQVVCKEDIEWLRADELDKYLVNDQEASMELGKSLCRFAFVHGPSGSPNKFVWTIHHGLYDGWSLPLILDLVNKSYRGIAVPETAKFNAFIQQATRVKDSESFWQPYLEDGDFEPFPNVPPQVREPVADSMVDYHQALIIPETNVGFKSKATVSTLVRAALGIVIGRHTGSTDVVFGTITSGRNSEVSGIEEIIGPTIGTVPIRIQIPTRETAISDFLAMTQSQATEMIAYEQTGLPRIAQISEDTRRACSFQTLLDVQSGNSRPQSDDTFLGKWTSPSDQRGFATYALTIECVFDSNGEFDVKASFDSRVLDRWVVERLLEQLGTVLGRLMTAQPGQTLGDVDSLSTTEASTIWEWNKSVPDSVNRCVPDLVQEQVQRRPMAPAICAWDGELTFKELDDLASRLAHYLTTLGVGPEVIVPLCFEKSLWTIVAMLGVLKAGGSFVCLDPSNAASQRRRHILEECSARVVLTSELFSTIELPSGCSPIVIGRDVVMSMTNPQPQDATSTSMQATSPAYLIFTSGSTGKPKGVVIEHAAISTSCMNHGQKLGFGQSSRVLQFSSYTFDACILEIFTTLVHGGCVCVPDEEQRLGDLSGAINALEANTLMLTPTVARTIEPDSVKTVTTLFLGGEASLQSDFERWSGLPSLLNAYGPTECAICTMVEAIKPGTKVGTIGRAAGCTSWIVDPTDHNRLSPLGSVGELLLEGPVLAREYLHDPEKTSAAFLKNPDWLVAGHEISGHQGRSNRLYKTGDLVRYLEDGSITFLGRKDTQAKIRGQRIELAEVEHHVQDCVKGAKQVVAEVITPAGDHSRAILTVFMEIRAGARKARDDPDSSSIQTKTAANGIDVILIDAEEKAAISRQIPAYMMPALYLQVPQIPLSSAGKADRKKLREQMSQFSAQQLADLMAAPEATITKRHPVTEAQKRISSLWAEVLNIDINSIGLDDTFLGLGGNSIGAMKLAAVARQAGLSLTVSEIFRHPLLEDLASHTETRTPELQNIGTPEPYGLLDPSTKDRIMHHLASSSPRVTMDEVVDVLPLTAFQEDTLQQSLEWPRQSFNYFFLDFNDDLDVARLDQSFQTILKEYPLLRSTFVNSGGRFWQVVHKEMLLPLSVINVQDDVESASNSLCCEDTEHNAFQPGRPATSFTLVRGTDQRCRIILRLSHAQYDGISLPIIIGTLLDSYQGSSPPSHADFSIFLNYARQREEISIKYWRRILDGSEITQVVPLLARSLAGTESLTQQPQKIVVEDVVNIPQLPEKITLATLINSAWAVVLSAITKQEDVVYGATVTGRNADIPAIKDIVGPCMNMVPVRAQLSRHQTSHALMRSIQEQYHLIGAADSLGFDKIIEHSTNWAPGSKFDFFFQHQGIEEHSQYGFEGSHTKLTGFSNPSFVPPVLGTVSYPTKAGVRIQVFANTHIATDTKVVALLDCVCKTAARLAADGDAPLSSFKPDISRINL